MSRLNSFVRRLCAQRSCLDAAAARIAGLPGPVIELGLGNGRTYDHLRTLFPGRRIIVIERDPRPHPDCWPPPEDLLIGGFAETLPLLARDLPHAAAFVHCDIGSGDAAANAALAAVIAPMLPPLLHGHGLVAADQPLDHADLEPAPLPPDVEPGRYFLYKPA